MIEVVGVRFKQAGKIYYFSPGEFALSAFDKVIVETARGVEFGEVVISSREVPEEEVVLPLKQVIRKATVEDEVGLESNKAKEKEAFHICLKKIADHHLPMKLVDVEYTFDGNKIIFSFTAEGRVDFRDLVKDLAAVFRTRIELRQIGVRDEAKMLGGVGSCGRVLCCSSFLGDFEPVSIRMAKDQKLSLNPTKISGICGRLMCCLKYENDCYGCGDKEEGKKPVFSYEEAYPVEGKDGEIVQAKTSPLEIPGERRAEPAAVPASAPKGRSTSQNRKGDQSKGRSERA
ncbi:MAG: PSP1 domain-containing protein [Desulfitobacteriaceae bacterium]